MDNYGNGYNNGYQNNSNGQYNNGQYNNGQYQQSYNGQQGYQSGPEFIPGGPGTGNNHPQFMTYLVLSILSCCCCNGIFGLVALIISIIGNNNFKTGQPYEGNFKAAKIILIIGLVLGIICNIINLIINGAAIMGSMGSLDF